METKLYLGLCTANIADPDDEHWTDQETLPGAKKSVSLVMKERAPMEPTLTTEQKEIARMLGVREGDLAAQMKRNDDSRRAMMQRDGEPTGITVEIEGVIQNLEAWLSQGVTDDRGTLKQIAAKLNRIAG